MSKYIKLADEVMEARKLRFDLTCELGRQTGGPGCKEREAKILQQLEFIERDIWVQASGLCEAVRVLEAELVRTRSEVEARVRRIEERMAQEARA